jgi:single-strand DNA-binding protein
LCKAFKKRGETINQYCKKGDLIGVEGSIRTGSYEKEDGTKAYTSEIMVENVHFLTPNTNTPTNDKTSQNKAKNNVKQETSEEIYADFGDSIEISDEDIAF